MIYDFWGMVGKFFNILDMYGRVSFQGDYPYTIRGVEVSIALDVLLCMVREGILERWDDSDRDIYRLSDYGRVWGNAVMNALV